MNRTTGWLAVIVGLAVPTSRGVEAAVLISEPFNQAGTMGTAPYNAWTSVSGTGPQLTVSATNGLQFGSSDRDYTRTLTSQTGAVYFGLDLAPQTLPATGTTYFLALNNGGSFVGRFFIASANSGTNYNLGVGVNASSAATSTSANFSLSSRRIVGSYNPSNGSISLWEGSFNLGSPLITATGATAASINGFTIRQADNFDNGESSIFLTNLVVSDDFASAVAVPEPAPVALTGCGLLAAAALAARHRATRDSVTA